MKKKAFTLLELTVCIGLLALLSSVIIWNIKKMLDVHEFRKEIETVSTEINKAQMVALSYKADLDIHFFKKDKKYYMQIVSDARLKLLKLTKPISLNKVFECKFNEEKVEKLCLHLYSNGRMEPLGVLTFYDHPLMENETAIKLDFKTPLLIKCIYPEK